MENMAFPGISVVKNLPANSGDAGLIPGSGKFPGEGNCNPLQCFSLGNPMDRGAWPGWRILSITLLACEISEIVQCLNILWLCLSLGME